MKSQSASWLTCDSLRILWFLTELFVMSDLLFGSDFMRLLYLIWNAIGPDSILIFYVYFPKFRLQNLLNRIKHGSNASIVQHTFSALVGQFKTSFLTLAIWQCVEFKRYESIECWTHYMALNHPWPLDFQEQIMIYRLYQLCGMKYFDIHPLYHHPP